MKGMSGVLALALAMVLAPGCASVNGRQAAIEGGAGAVIGTVLGFVAGTTIGHPKDGARIGAAVGGTVGATHGLFNRDEEIIAEQKKIEDSLALSNQALTQVLQNQSAGRPAGNKVVADKNPSTKSAGGTPSCNCPDTEVYNATKSKIVVKLGSDKVGTDVFPHAPMCFGPGKVFAAKAKKTIPPGDWIVKDPGEHKKVIFTDDDFLKKK